MSLQINIESRTPVYSKFLTMSLQVNIESRTHCADYLVKSKDFLSTLYLIHISFLSPNSVAKNIVPTPPCGVAI